MTVEEEIARQLCAQITPTGHDKLVMWSIFDRPRDYPNSIVAREFIIEADGAKPGRAIVAQPKHLPVLRRAFAAMGFVLTKPAPSDPANMLETWL